MGFIDIIKEKAKGCLKTIVLPEANDVRVLKATEIICKEKIANIILIGNHDEIQRIASENNIDISESKIIDNSNSDKTDYYINQLYELRKEKGMAIEEATNLIKNNTRYFASMMVKLNDADGYVSGACHSTMDTLSPTLKIIKGAPGIKTVSAFFIMVLKDKEFGDNGVFIYADSGMNENPNEEQLSDIAISSARSYKELVNPDGVAKVAMLSYSTKGSAKSELTEKVINATRLAYEKAPDIDIDGELQLDAAIIPEVALLKAPESKVAGKANILVFPDLNAGNIGYKLTQRLAHAEAYGPLCQGLARPVNDLSRGCSVDDIVGVVAITCVQAQKND